MSSHSLCILLIVATRRGTCQPQSHDARLAAVDPWVTANRRQRVYIVARRWVAGYARRSAVCYSMFAGGTEPPFSVSFRKHLPRSAGIAAAADAPFHATGGLVERPTLPCHRPSHIRIPGLKVFFFNNIIIVDIIITDDLTRTGRSSREL